ncbi:MAG: hypothetical protein NZ703_15010, partial [Gemmataceae bacterium]|nr:hypothetical protein [Gemmataceae bacterium]
AANTVRGQPVGLSTEAFLFGAVYEQSVGVFVFDATTQPDCNPPNPNDPIKHPAVLVQAVGSVPTLWGNLLGHSLPSGKVTAFTVAVYPCGSNQQPKLIWVHKVITP